MILGKKGIFILTLIFFIIFSSCVSTTPMKKLTYEEIKKHEIENQALLIKIVGTFFGSAIGGTIGVVSSPADQAFKGALSGCLVGGIAGFSFGYLVSENTKPKEIKPEAENPSAEDYFNDYRNIQLKDKK
jgi:hypothetical protein